MNLFENLMKNKRRRAKYIKHIQPVDVCLFISLRIHEFCSCGPHWNKRFQKKELTTKRWKNDGLNLIGTISEPLCKDMYVSKLQNGSWHSGVEVWKMSRPFFISERQGPGFSHCTQIWPSTRPRTVYVRGYSEKWKKNLRWGQKSGRQK